MSEMLPVNRSKTQARRYYDRISRFYDTLTAGEQRLVMRGVDLLSIRPGERVLEIGCGTGSALQIITAAASNDGRVIGLDLSRKMLLTSRNKNRTPAYIQGDGACLPLQSGTFDAVFSAFTLELFSEEDIHTVLAKCRRVLKPTGRLGVVSLTMTPHTLALRLYELAHRLFPVAVDCRPIPLERLLEKNGFRILTAEKASTWGLPVTLTLSVTHSPDQQQKKSKENQ